MWVDVGDIRMRYRLDGPMASTGRSEPLTLVLSHSLATRLEMWKPQVGAFASRYRVLRYDCRGHGDSTAPDRPYSMQMLAEDVRGLLERLDIPRVCFVGLSLGGMVGQLFAATYPEMVSSLVLSDTACRVAPEAGPLWDERISVARHSGMEPHIESTIARWFTPSFISAHPEVVDPVRSMIRDTDPRGYVGCAHAVKDFDAADKLAAIAVPTLVMVGREDPGTPVEAARAIQERIRRAELVVLPEASHLCNLEQPEVFNRTVMQFLERVEAALG